MTSSLNEYELYQRFPFTALSQMTKFPAGPIKAKIAPFGGSKVVDYPVEIQRLSRSQAAVRPPLTLRKQGTNDRKPTLRLGCIRRDAGGRGEVAVL